MPIVRFIVTSLPLEHLVKDSQDVPYAIDYACGAGHFLTEYADRIKEFVLKYRPDLPLQDYYSRITGIEKEYRLSKVSKVSAFMYGHDETQIVYSDALQSHPNIEEGKYSVLIANPPYSVSGFLETLNERDRKKYKLFNNNINLAKNNAIETFFMERAAQLMKAGGVAGIVLPMSVLNKGGIYAKAREIILENFHIVSLVELGSGTFGKTGTNTVVMFLRRKETNTPDADHYTSRVECWFNLSENADEVYQDTELMEKYCEYLGYAVDDYQEFLKGNLTETFLASEVVQTYHNSFFGNSRTAMKDVCEEAKNIRTKYVAKTKTASFRALSDEDKQKEANKAFYAFVKAIEREKMYFFVLAVQTENPVLLVKSPLPKKNESTEKIKKFLGYEWINCKGHEGIHYLNVGTGITENEGDDENEADDETMQEISGINAINTPLFNPFDLLDDGKINTLIRKNFTGEEIAVPDELFDNVSISSIIDIVDFKHTGFNKSFRTQSIKEFKYVTKWKLASLGSLTVREPEYGANESAKDGNPQTDYRYIRITDINDTGYLNKDWKTAAYIDSKYILSEGDILFARSGATAGKTFYYKQEYGKAIFAGYLIRFTFDNSKVLPQYVINVLDSNVYQEWVEYNRGGSSQPNLNAKQFASFEIPVPDMTEQTKIIKECSIVENLYTQSIKEIELYKKELDVIVNDSLNHATIDLRLDNEQIFDLSIGRRVLRSELKTDGMYEVYSANVFEPFGRVNSSLLSDFTTPSVLWGIDGDWMVNHLPAERPFHPTDHCGVIKVLDENVVLSKYMVYPLLKAGEHERFSRANRASTERIKALTIRVPSIEIQRETVAKVIEIENKIETLRMQMEECQSRKQSILDKYLK